MPHEYEDRLSVEALLAELDAWETLNLPRSIHYYAEVGSTMDVAREHLRHASDAQVPMLILTDFQSTGRGRMQRPWVIPAGSAVIFSLVLRPTWLPSQRATALVWMVGVALCEAIAATTHLQPVLKWPNDVLVPLPTTPTAGAAPAHLPTLAKVAGILVESSSTLMPAAGGADVQESHLEWAIIGCGLNVNAAPPADTPLRYPATSLAAAAGVAVPRLPLLRVLLQRLDHWYAVLQRGDYEMLFAAWRLLLSTLGRETEVQTESGLLRGVAEDVDSYGALQLRDAAGTLHTVTSGDL